jgi:hypothetical protein
MFIASAYNFASNYVIQRVEGKREKVETERSHQLLPAEGLLFAKENVSTRRMQEHLKL